VRILSLSILSQNGSPRVPTARCYVQPRSYIGLEDLWLNHRQDTDSMRLFQSIAGLAGFAGLVCSALIEVPFGDSALHNNRRLHIIHPRTNYDPNNIANAETWGTYATKGGWLNCLLDMTDSEAGKAWPDWVGGGGGGEAEGWWWIAWIARMA